MTDWPNHANMLCSSNTHREWAVGRRLMTWRPERFCERRRIMPLLTVGMGFPAAVHVEDFCRWFPDCALWMKDRTILLDTVRGLDGHYLCAIMGSPVQAEALHTTWGDHLRLLAEAFTSRSMRGSRFRTTYVERIHAVADRHDSIRRAMPHFLRLPPARPTADELQRLDSMVNGPYHQTVIHPNSHLYFRDKQDFVLARMLLAS